MTKPAGVQYYIVNKETTDDGKDLAVTFNGRDAVVTVTEFQRLPTQVWQFRDLIDVYAGAQWIQYQDTTLPVNIDNDGFLVVKMFLDCDKDQRWQVRGGEQGIYTIQDEAYRDFWGLKKAVVGERVSPTTSERRYWRLIPVPVTTPPPNQCTTM